MSDRSLFVSQRAKKNGVQRYFYRINFETRVFSQVRFDDLESGDRFLFIEDGKKSETWIAVNSPFTHRDYGQVVESIPHYKMQETVTADEIRQHIKKTEGITPVYVSVNGRIYAVEDMKFGLHGEMIIDTAENPSDSPVQYADHLPVIDQSEQRSEAA